MEIRCFCPHCGQAFAMEVDAPRATEKKKRNMSDEERALRAERMRTMRANGIGGRPKGSKNSHPRADKGQARKAPGGA